MTDSPEFRRQQAEMQDLRGFLENTMTENKQPDRLDVEMQRFAELRRQAALIEELREALKEAVEMFEVTGFASSDGCAMCRAALAKAEAQS